MNQKEINKRCANHMLVKKKKASIEVAYIIAKHALQQTGCFKSLCLLKEELQKAEGMQQQNEDLKKDWDRKIILNEQTKRIMIFVIMAIKNSSGSLLFTFKFSFNKR